MRRNDREITDRKTIEEFIANERIIRIGLYDNGEVYIVPVNYGYSVSGGGYTFYFHGAMAGRKYELALSSPAVGFEIDSGYELIRGEKACGHSAKYQSVIGTGKLSLIEGSDDKKAAFEYIMKQAAGRTGLEYSDEVISRTAVFRLDVNKMSCKARQ